MRVAIYARVSTADQNCENQLLELRRFAQASGWLAEEFVETASGASKDRPVLDELLRQVRWKRFDALLVWKLDRLGRSVQDLVNRLNELRELDVAFISMGEGINTTTSAGQLVFHVMAALAEFERARLIERTHLGLQRARAQGKKLGRPRRTDIVDDPSLSIRKAAQKAGVAINTIARRRLERALS